MSRESDLLFGLLALQMNFLSKEHLLEGAAVWMADPKADLPKLLLERGFIKASQHGVIRALVEEQLKANGGDVERSLVAATVDRAVRDGLLGLKPPAGVGRTLAALKPRDAGAQTVTVAPPSRDRYRLGNEIARGGLGKVVEAFDARLERDVAVKLVLDDLPAELAERFEREAKLTGRLDHPNIVPIYDFGTLGVGKKLFLSMKRIRGRDLGKLLKAIGQGDQASRRTYSRARLLRVFQDICLGMAFAHDRGVIHRDLKPANVMIGDYGETLIVDWGLARVRGERAEGREGGGGTANGRLAGEPSALPPSRPSALTLDGEVLGTPAYMAPEQAAGQLHEMDHRSDVYALGAILYEILTLHAPFEGKTAHEIISKVLSGRITPPSHRVAASADPDRTVVKAPSTHAATDPIPPELDAICLKALAFRREDRYQTATELHDEVQLFLEGVKEREREHAAAEEAVTKAKEAIARHGRLTAEAEAAGEEAKKKGKEVKTKEDKQALWAAEDHARGLEREGVEAFAEANATLTLALDHERGHVEARRLKAELFWGRFLEAEEKGDGKEMLLSRRTVEQYNDGPLDALLKGDGTLAVRARAYPCRCLLDGRTVRPEELAHLGYHPFSGRALDGHKGAEGLPEYEPMGPAPLKVHEADCKLEPILGADVWLWRYEEVGRLLMPVTPAGAAAGPAAPIDAVFAPDSPFPPTGPGLYLGRTPIERRTLPMGSYLLILHREGSEPIRCPVTVPRCGAWEQEVTIYRPGEIPEGFIPIPAGAFGYQGDPENPHAGPAETKTLDDFFIARHPVTCREYGAFLNDLAQTNPSDAAKRVPRESQVSGFYWPGPPYVVPTSAWLAQAPEDLKAKGRRLSNSPVDWEEDRPVFGVSWEDGLAFSAWKRTREGGPVTLLHEIEWEKAARGTDRRWFPFGKHFDDEWCNTIRSHKDGMRPVVVGGFPHDESPYGVRGLAGNSRDACLNDPGPEYPGWRLFRGGSWSSSGINSRASYRGGGTTRSVYFYNGLRVGRPVRLPRTP
ncbi:MAG: protein kinase [Planctomycetes bacterium]|nr:protein kinase [Planctomycetota bacterium]